MDLFVLYGRPKIDALAVVGRCGCAHVDRREVAMTFRTWITAVLMVAWLSACKGAATAPNVQATVDAAVRATLGAAGPTTGDDIGPLANEWPTATPKPARASATATAAPTAFPPYSLFSGSHVGGPAWLAISTRITTGAADSDHAGYRMTVLEYDLVNVGQQPQLFNVSSTFASGIFIAPPSATDSRGADYSCAETTALAVGTDSWARVAAYVPPTYFLKFRVTCAIANTAQDAQILLRVGLDNQVPIPVPLGTPPGDKSVVQDLNVPGVTTSWQAEQIAVGDVFSDPQFAEATLESLTLSDDRSSWIAAVRVKNLYGSDMGSGSMAATLYSDSSVSGAQLNDIANVTPGSEADWRLEFPAAGNLAEDHLLVITIQKPNLEIAGQLLFWAPAP